MATDPRIAVTVDPVYELFWREVAQAVDMVSTNMERSIAVAIGDRKASVTAGTTNKFVKILISEYKAPQPTLIVPPGSNTLDPRDTPEDTQTGENNA